MFRNRAHRARVERMAFQRAAAFLDPAQARRDFIARQPMGRLATPEEIASLAVYLGSDEAEYITGTVQVIDGGMPCEPNSLRSGTEPVAGAARHARVTPALPVSREWDYHA